MKQIIEQALAQTAELWGPIERAQRWVQDAAVVLANEERKPSAEVRADLARTLRSIGVTKRHCGPLEAALDHFLKVTRSYRPGLFHCYEDEAIPRTNNALEQCFGQHRYHERRATGRKAGSPSIVLHGPVRLIASTASRLREFTPSDLELRERERWQTLRQAVRRRFSLRAQGQRFRRDPDAYLAQLEQAVLK